MNTLNKVVLFIVTSTFLAVFNANAGQYIDLKTKAKDGLVYLNTKSENPCPTTKSYYDLIHGIYQNYLDLYPETSHKNIELNETIQSSITQSCFNLYEMSKSNSMPVEFKGTVIHVLEVFCAYGTPEELMNAGKPSCSGAQYY